MVFFLSLSAPQEADCDLKQGKSSPGRKPNIRGNALYSPLQTPSQAGKLPQKFRAQSDESVCRHSCQQNKIIIIRGYIQVVWRTRRGGGPLTGQGLSPLRPPRRISPMRFCLTRTLKGQTSQKKAGRGCVH